jgi:hypothetical protein
MNMRRTLIGCAVGGIFTAPSAGCDSSPRSCYRIAIVGSALWMAPAQVFEAAEVAIGGDLFTAGFDGHRG